MGWMKLTIYLAGFLLLQTVVFPRLSVFGAAPDLVLVSVIVFSVLKESSLSAAFAGISGFLQDILSAGIYLNTIIKVAVSALISRIKEEFLGDEYSLALTLVAALTPLQFILEAAVIYFFMGRQFSPFYFFLRMIVTTLYNLILTWPIYWIMKGIARGE